MERLTDRRGKLTCVQDHQGCFTYRSDWPKYIHRALERLAEYEDTGLTTAEVKEMAELSGQCEAIAKMVTKELAKNILLKE